MTPNTDIKTKDLRSFGFIVGGVFGAIGLLPLLTGHDVKIWAVIVAALLFLPATSSPHILSWPYRGWMAVGHILGWLNTRVILGSIFYGIITPVGVLARLFGYDPLALNSNKQLESYRVALKAKASTHMDHQF